MATRSILSESAPANIHTGSTISELDKMVERALTTGPLMSLAQIRMLLHVTDACEPCEGTGAIYSNHGDSGDNLIAEKCDACRGRGYVDVAEPRVQ